MGALSDIDIFLAGRATAPGEESPVSHSRLKLGVAMDSLITVQGTLDSLAQRSVGLNAG